MYILVFRVKSYSRTELQCKSFPEPPRIYQDVIYSIFHVTSAQFHLSRAADGYETRLFTRDLCCQRRSSSVQPALTLTNENSLGEAIAPSFPLLIECHIMLSQARSLLHTYIGTHLHTLLIKVVWSATTNQCRLVLSA